MSNSYRINLTFFLLLSVQLFFLANLQFTAWPEMFSYAYLRNNGFLIYKDMIHPYTPLLTMVLSWIYTLFGYHLWVLQTAAWAVAISTSVLVFLLTKQVTKNSWLALVSLALYVFLQPFFEGNMLWFDLAIMPPLLLALLFLLRRNLLLSGLFIAAAMLIKQTTGLYFLFSIFYLVFVQKLRFSKLKRFFYGSLILGIPLLIRLIQENALSDFVNWVLIYPLTKWGNIIGYVRMEMSVHEVVVILILLTPIVFKFRQLLNEKNSRIVLLFLVCALIAVYPRFSFFHFQMSLAIISILYGALLARTGINLKFVSLYALVLMYLVHYPVLLRSWRTEPRFYSTGELELAEVIKQKTTASDRLYLLGLNSTLYSMSGRLPPERWTDNFAWYLEIQGVQEEVINRWITNPPEYVFWRTPSTGNKHDLGVYQPKKIAELVRSNYTQKEEVKPGIWMWVQRPPQD